MNEHATSARAWYREPWPWLLMLPPLASVAGGLVMLYLALSEPPEIMGSGAEPLAIEHASAHAPAAETHP